MKEVALSALGAVGVFVLGLFTEAYRSRQSRRDAERTQQRLEKAARNDRRDAFELETLVNIEPALQEYMLAQSGRIRLRLQHLAATGVWPAEEPAGIEETSEMLRATWALDRLKGRVLREDIREKLGDVQEHIRIAASRTDENVDDVHAGERAKSEFLLGSLSMAQANRMIADRIRQLHEELD